MTRPTAHLCGVCGVHRHDQLAYGAGRALTWFCLDCGPDRAKEVHHMTDRSFDAYEACAAEGVAFKIAERSADGVSLSIPIEELQPFVRFVLRTYREEIVKAIETKPPF